MDAVVLFMKSLVHDEFGNPELRIHKFIILKIQMELEKISKC